MKTCNRCGAVLSHTEAQFEDIVGQEHAKRALEVAIAGNHTISFFGSEGATCLAEIATRYGLTAWAIQTCPCGNWGFSPHAKECTCSLSQVSRWRKRKAYQNALGAEIVVECPPPYPHQMEKWLDGQRGEPESSMLVRIEKQGVRPTANLDKTSKSLLKCAAVQLKLEFGRVKSMLRVAQTVAALANCDRIGTVHLAEAIQYRPRHAV